LRRLDTFATRRFRCPTEGDAIDLARGSQALFAVDLQNVTAFGPILVRAMSRSPLGPARSQPMTETTAASSTTIERSTLLLALIALAGALLAGGTRFLDPDAWHQMALIREALASGRIPRADPFAYTSSVEPMVHHEWGMGVVQYALARTLGWPGFALLRDVLAVGVLAACLLCARRRGAGYPVLWATLPVAVLMLWVGITTVRAQMFTLFFLATLLLLLELDRAGRRWWTLPWLLMYVLWANLHGGFVVGVAAVVLHTFEQGLSRRPLGHLLATLAAMAALVALNPYGADYYAYLWHGLSMARPNITEWRSVLQSSWVLIVAYATSLLLLGYAFWRGDLAKTAGALFVFAAAYEAARHQRHLSIYAVAWACFVPAALQHTPLGSMLSRGLAPGRRAVTVAAAVAALGGLGAYLKGRPWEPRLPADPGEAQVMLYPVGAVDYLRQNEFRGKLLTPFSAGAFVTWQLYPGVLVSMDGRYEVAYEQSLLDRHLAFYRAEQNWERLLDDPPADAVLTRSDAQVVERLDGLPGWRRVYRDDAYQIFARAPSHLPTEDRRGERLTPTGNALMEALQR
jgi:hypothetical protein